MGWQAFMDDSKLDRQRMPKTAKVRKVSEAAVQRVMAQERLAPEPEECIFAEVALFYETETRLDTDDEST